MRAPVVLLALLLVPVASAHLGNFADTKTVIIPKEYYVQVDPRPQPLYANESVRFEVFLQSTRTGRYVTDTDVARLTFTLDGDSFSVDLQPTANESMAAPVTFPREGNWTTRLDVKDANGEHVAETWMDVFPDLPYRFRPLAADQFTDPGVNETTTFTVETFDPNTGERTDPLQDLKAKLEWWDDPHLNLLGTEEVSFTKEGPGTWRFEHVFRNKGQYHLRFGSTSGNLGYEDAPMLHMYALEETAEPSNEAPAPGLFVVLVAVGFLALFWQRR